MSAAVSAPDDRDSAAATPISALKPLLDAVGLVMAYRRSPECTRAAMSAHVTLGLPIQPNARALLSLIPSTTGDNMMRSCAFTRFRPASLRIRYFAWENHTASNCSPALS